MERRVHGLRWLGPIVFVLGIAAVAYGLSQGQGNLSLFLIFPVVTATGIWSAVGIGLILVGFIATFFVLPAVRADVPMSTAQATSETRATTEAREPAPQASRRWGGVVFLGPIPIVFGSDAKVVRWMLVAGLLLFIGLVLLTLFTFWRL
jgi:uncharacterized protein (TIGR00304 family)